MSAFTEITDDPATWPPIQDKWVLIYTPPIRSSIVGGTVGYYRPSVEYIYSKMTCENLAGSYWRPLDKGDYPEGMAP